MGTQEENQLGTMGTYRNEMVVKKSSEADNWQAENACLSTYYLRGLILGTHGL